MRFHKSFGYAKTHYYGGIKKYQWVTIPLEIRGVIVKADGEKIFGEVTSDDDFETITFTED